MSRKSFDIIIIGGGIIGTAVALSVQNTSRLKILLIEAENELAHHQTGNNSGVIHSGLYYKPGSLKAKNCSEGGKLLYSFCEKHDIPFKKCGKIVVATSESELNTLNELHQRGIANGLTGIKKLNAKEIKNYEPHSAGIAGLFVPQTGIVDYSQVTKKYAQLFIENGGCIETDCAFLSIKKSNDELVVDTTKGEFNTKLLVNCGGLYSDRIAKLCGVDPGLQIIPFRGEYYKLKKEKEYLVNNLIYPVPDPRFPFLGVHFTRMINGGVEAGPNAVLAFKREGYRKKDFSFTDISKMISYSGFWKMTLKYYRMGFEEFYRSYSKKAFVKALQKLLPEVQENDIEPGGSGVRAQALALDGKLIDDFRIVETERMVHVLNAPSPAATASISIGRKISEMVIKKL
ncbi:MAG: L-2-hydroxyglutarate oxidase [Ignavibacteriaceae bacterium]|jgi:(S)-2-hydroxyglutarate dehydrogenase|nr:L-2-hydroxyglutarate oxidase [Ignavibacteriaceae bacterium]